MITLVTVLAVLVTLNVILLIFSVNKVQPSTKKEGNYIRKVEHQLLINDLEYSSFKKAG